MPIHPKVFLKSFSGNKEFTVSQFRMLFFLYKYSRLEIKNMGDFFV